MINTQRSWWMLMVFGLLIAGGQLHAQEEEIDAASQWADYNHYVRIARPDLAASAGQALLNAVDLQELLDIVEASNYKNYTEATFRVALKIDTLRPVTEKLAKAIQSARVSRSREPARIKADIQNLGQSRQADVMITRRLVAAGQHAAPFLLEALLDGTQKRIHPHVMAVMVESGRPMVYPLSVALGTLEPVPQGQVAQILAEIGYPRALPYLKQIIEDSDTDDHARDKALMAYSYLTEALRVPSNVSAAELFLTLGQNYYAAGSEGDVLPGYDAQGHVGLIWHYDRDAGLLHTDVPGPIYADVLAMNAAIVALKLNPNQAASLSLWLMANLRRENRMPPGVIDPSYPRDYREARAYLLAAGPLAQHDVLNQALVDKDPELALDAIWALDKTGGTAIQINREGAIQPLLKALTYHDRRVRFHSAFALAKALPRIAFEGIHAVVRVLAEAVRTTDIRYAVVVGPDAAAKAQLIKELGYVTYARPSLQEVARLLVAEPGIDLIVTAGLDADQVEALHYDRLSDYKLEAIPIVALLSTTAGASARFARISEGLHPTLTSDSAEDLRSAVEQAAEDFAGQTISSQEADDLASRALDLLLDLVKERGEIFKVIDAQPALVRAIRDKRPQIARKASSVLAMLDSEEAQQTIAQEALNIVRSNDLRVAFLSDLAQSAKHFSNRLTQPQLDRILDLVKTSQGKMALAAGMAHGALDLPTSNVVEMLSD